MENLFKIFTALFQLGLTFVITFIVYMVFALFDYKGGIDSFVGLAVFQPIEGIILSWLTILVCYGIGLPIRLNNKLNAWWTQRTYLPIIAIIIGLIMLCISLTPPFIQQVTSTIEGIDRTDTVPNQFLCFTGWFLTAFSALHLFPPKKWIESIKSKFKM